MQKNFVYLLELSTIIGFGGKIIITAITSTNTLFLLTDDFFKNVIQINSLAINQTTSKLQQRNYD